MRRLGVLAHTETKIGRVKQKTSSSSAPPAPETGVFAKPQIPAGPPLNPWTRFDTYATLVVAGLAIATRFIGVTIPTAQDTPVFDEKHYVPQAWDMVRSWFNPIIGGIESNPGYGLVVHPPLAKQIMAYSELVFGYTPLGWRFAAALFGCFTILMIMACARRLSGSSLVAVFAAILALFDGVLLTGSRFGMLDIFQTFFIVAAAYCIIRDFHQVWGRLQEAAATGNLGSSIFGPRLGFRWWRFLAGVNLGLVVSIKWSGLYYMAFFGLLTVGLDVYLRRRYNVKRPYLGALIRDSVPAFCSIVIVPIALYAWSWRAWFSSETAIYRHAATDGTISEDSKLHLLPDTLASWFYYHSSVLEFHASLTTSGGHDHPWDSKPWTWLVAGRPILYLSATDIDCGATTCRRMLYLFGTPAIWWLTVPVLIWGLWQLFLRRDWQVVIPLVGFGAGFIPWLIGYDRQMYFFYATALVPFTILLLALFLGQLMSIGPNCRHPLLRRMGITSVPAGAFAVCAYLGLVVAMFGYFSPILYGYTISDATYESLMWLPSWR